MTDSTLTRAIAEHASLDAATPRNEADDVAATRQALDDLRHAAADLIRLWNAAHPSEAATDPQSGFRPQAATRGKYGPHVRRGCEPQKT